MICNRNGYWMSPKFMFLMSPDDGGGAGGDGGNAGGAGDNGAGCESNPAGNDGNKDAGNGGNDPKTALEAQIEQLKADMAKQKAALDAATKEAAGYKRDLRAKQTQEEIDAANKKEAEEKAAKELEELRKEVARAKSTKSVMSKLGVDEDAAGKIAECMAGCEDIENALLLVRQAWEAREKALRLEFGKIPGPGAGGSNEEDAEEKAALEIAKRFGKNRAEANKSVTEGLKGYIR